MVPRWILAYSSIALAALVVLLVSCGGGGGGGEVHVPVISNPSVYPDWLTAGDGGGAPSSRQHETLAGGLLRVDCRGARSESQRRDVVTRAS